MESSYRIVVLDGQTIIRWGIRELLKQVPGMDLVGEASCISEAQSLIRTLNPNLLITELSLPDGNGVELTKRLSSNESIKVLAYSDPESWQIVEEFLNAGGTGFLSKRAPVYEITEAIQATAAGKQWISPNIRSVENTQNSHDLRELTTLTKREREIVSLIANGLTSKQIANQLSVSLKTVEAHRYRIFKKLKMHRSSQLVRCVVESGFDPDAPFESGTS